MTKTDKEYSYAGYTSLPCRLPPCPPALVTIQTTIVERVRKTLEMDGYMLQVTYVLYYRKKFQDAPKAQVIVIKSNVTFMALTQLQCTVC